MEDISDYKNLRTELMIGKSFTHLAENISTFLVDTLLPTTDLFLSRAEMKNNVKIFMNPELCDISEDLVLTEPYWDYKKRNIILDDNFDFVRENLSLFFLTSIHFFINNKKKLGILFLILTILPLVAAAWLFGK